MLFAGDDGVKQVKVLSGGEKGSLYAIQDDDVQATNVLILDEPTNHLDMESITALEQCVDQVSRCACCSPARIISLFRPRRIVSWRLRPAA